MERCRFELPLSRFRMRASERWGAGGASGGNASGAIFWQTSPE